MSTTYKIKSSATRAAKAQFGEGWKEVATIVEVEGGFQIQTEVAKSFDPVKKDVAVIEQLQAIEADVKAKKAKKAEIESRKPAFIPLTPILEPVAKIPAPAPEPISAPIEEIAPPAELPVAYPIIGELAAFIKEGDKAADAALVAPRIGHAICPNCGSEELYRGEIDPANNSVVINEDSVEGCHQCDWEVRLTKEEAVKAARPRLSTAEKPTKKVWHVADSMPNAKRKEVIEECVRQGIAYGTARTQYQHWFKCKADSAAAPIATIGADGKITMPNK